MRKLIAGIFLSFLTINLYGQSHEFVNHNEIGILSYGPVPLDFSYTIKTTNGISLGENYHVGISTGLDRHTADGLEKLWILPVSGQFKYFLKPARKAAFYGGIDAGYGFSFLNKEISSPDERISYKGGFLLNPQVGLRFKKPNRNTSLTISLGYKMQQISVEKSWNYTGLPTPNDQTSRIDGFDRITQRDFDMHRLVFTVGIGF